MKKKTTTKSMVKLGFFSIMLMTITAVLSLRNFPAQGALGYQVIFYVIIGAILFFIPSALISAELSATFNEDGGVYLWTRKAFGRRVGFFAQFMQWAENLPWFPAMLTFIGSAVIFMFDPALAMNENPPYYFTILIFIFVMVGLWGSTLINIVGLKWSNFFSSTGAIFGVVIPGLLLISLSIAYVATGRGNELGQITWSSLFPDLTNFNNLSLLVGLLVGLAGMELTSVHVRDTKNPQKVFPRALLLATLIIILINIAGSLALGFVIPSTELDSSLQVAICTTFDTLLKSFGLGWMTPIVTFLIAYGGAASVITWTLGPSKGLLATAEDGLLPASWSKRNKNNMPNVILIVQAVISSILACMLLIPDSQDTVFWLLTILTGQLYIIMYVIMFAAAIRLRYKYPHIKRAFKVPFGKFGIWLFGGFGVFSSLAVFCFGFIPQSNSYIPAWGSMTFLIVSLIGFTALPLIIYEIYSRKNKSLLAKKDEEDRIKDKALEEGAE